jgi:hypothetical protein
MLRRAQPEAALQRAVLDHLKWRAAPNLFAFHVPNGGWRSPVEAMVLKGLGTTPGIPDVLVIHDGKIYGLELKAAGRSITPIQRETHGRMRRAGAHVAVAIGIDQALDQLDAWQLLRRDSGKAHGGASAEIQTRETEHANANCT